MLARANSVDGGDILQVSNLSVIRSGTEVISDIDFSIKPGEFVGIVGPNGGGKTTLILTILGILRQQTGTINIYDNQHDESFTKTQIGWVPQAATNLPNNLRITVKEFIRLGSLNLWTCLLPMSKANKARVDEIIDTIGLTNYANTRLSSLSGGQRQRAAIGKALASNANLLLMDEPMVGVDIESRNSLMSLLRKLCDQQNKTIVMISHDLASIKKTVHRMVYLEKQVLFDGSTKDFPELSILADLSSSKQPSGESEELSNNQEFVNGDITQSSDSGDV
tara:strand:- start:167 stop:1003 length:837 start_codon:yes stop_codon:yes gene_type:complete